MIKIGVDARWYFNGPISGKVYVEGLIQSLAEKANVLAFSTQPITGIETRTFRYKFAPIFNTFFIPALARKEKCDWVLYQNVCPFFKPRQLKTAVVIHDVIFESHPHYFTWIERLYFKIIKLSIQNADVIIAISNFTKSQLLKYNYAVSEKIHVVHNGFTDRSLEVVSPKQTLPASYLLYVGRLNDRKNIRNLVLGFNKTKHLHSASLIIAGKPDSKFSNFFNNLTSEELDRIVLVGHVSDSDLDGLYRNATAFVYIPFIEGFGLPVLEAMKYGLPVITSNTSSLPEVGGEACLYVNPRDVDEISENLVRVMEDHALREKRRAASLIQAEMFSWDKCSDKLIQILDAEAGDG